jgi:hypothetical protein
VAELQVNTPAPQSDFFRTREISGSQGRGGHVSRILVHTRLLFAVGFRSGRVRVVISYAVNPERTNSVPKAARTVTWIPNIPDPLPCA